ncbi:MAG: sulfatase [Deltaproteobacteria bacterium]|nr:sulfatase [Deltaproteobacteria bacterium]
MTWTSRILALAFAACAFGCRAGGNAARDGTSSSARPSAVVLVTVDTLRADAVSFMGHEPATTPFADSLARKGVVFTRAYATSSWTPPSVASLVTSLAASSHGVVKGAILGSVGVRQPVLSGRLVTMAETFRRAGYRTIGAAANRHLEARLGFGQGFTAYFKEAAFEPADQLNATAVRLLARELGAGWEKSWKTARTFLWLHYFDPHDPYYPKGPWITAYAPDYREHPDDFPVRPITALVREFPRPDESLRSCLEPLYESEVRFTDDQLGRLASRMGLIDPNVLVVFTADHGEEMGEHGGLGHGRNLYEEVVRVPLAFYWPAGLPQGLRIDRPVSLLDVFPTVAELAGVAPPAGLQGTSLVPLMRGTASPEERPVLMELHPPHGNHRAIVQGRWKLIRPIVGDGKPVLYDLEADSKEKNDIASARPDIVRDLAPKMDAIVRALPQPPATKEVQLGSPEVEAQLRALGYIE